MYPRLARYTGSAMPTILNPFAKRIFQKELVDFFKNLALMSKSGMPLDDSLQVLAEQSSSGMFKKFLIEIKKQIEQGSSFSNALKGYRTEIGELVINIVRAGEINGTLEDNFQYLADILNRQRELTQKIQSALLYPEIVLAMAFSVGGGISIYVLPKLIPLFTTLNVKLPLATQILLFISRFLQSNGPLAMVGVVVIAFFFWLLGKINAVKWAYDTIALRVPFFGRLNKNYQLALFAQLFGTLFRSGLTIKETLSVTAEAMTNVRYRNTLLTAQKRLTSGIPLGKILSAHPYYFPRNATSIIAVGEDSGKLDESLSYLATYYDNEVDVMTKRLPTIIEPLMLLAIGLIVAFIAMAIISPIYEITNGIQVRQ